MGELVRQQRDLVHQLEAVAEDGANGIVRSKVRFLRGKNEVQATLTALESTCEREQMSTVVRLPGPKPRSEGATLNHRSLRRGVLLRDIVSAEIAPNWLRLCMHESLSEYGELFQTRVAAHGLLQLMVVDRSIALLGSGPMGTPIRVLLIEEPSLVQIVVDLAESIWTRAVPLEEGAWLGSVASLTVRQGHVLEHLCAGLDDDAIASLLCISSRTVRAEIAALLEYLGATSRCEAGFLAGQRGLVARPATSRTGRT